MSQVGWATARQRLMCLAFAHPTFHLPSPAGLTRGSIFLRKRMDCRVKPGNDTWKDHGVESALGANISTCASLAASSMVMNTAPAAAKSFSSPSSASIR